jgi:virginiamycin B lyase
MRNLGFFVVVGCAAFGGCTKFKTPVDTGADGGMDAGSDRTDVALDAADADGRDGASPDRAEDTRAPDVGGSSDTSVAEMGGVDVSSDGAPLPNGASCAADTSCQSNHCVDGRCCGVPSCGTCEACIGAGGTCSQVTKKEDPDTCNGMQTCNAIGKCVDRTTEFPLLKPSDSPSGIAAGADGNIWFALTNQIGRIGTDGTGLMEVDIPTANAAVTVVARGPDGNMWFAEALPAKVGRVSSSFDFMEFGVTANSNPNGIATGPDGNIWFTEYVGKLGRMTPNGTGLIEFSVPSGAACTAVGGDGNLWFVEDSGKIGRLSPNGDGLTELTVPAVGSSPQCIVAGSDGTLWFNDQGARQIGHVEQGGTKITMFTLPTPDSFALGLTAGPDGSLWFTDSGANMIGRIDSGNGDITEFTIPTANSVPFGITTGSDGNLWFAEELGHKIGRMLP